MRIQYFATKNIHKLREVSEILGYDLEQIAVDLTEPQALDVMDVVGEKAKDAFLKTGKIVLVEDTGLGFVVWNGLPGALVKWFVDAAGNEGILRMLKGETDRRAVAKTAFGFFDGAKAHVFSSELAGTIAETVRGTSSFGWDPLFIPDGQEKSFAEMTRDEKNALSMRRHALLAMSRAFEDAEP